MAETFSQETRVNKKINKDHKPFGSPMEPNAAPLLDSSEEKTPISGPTGEEFIRLLAKSKRDRLEKEKNGYKKRKLIEEILRK